jgi:hypothetical protein
MFDERIHVVDVIPAIQPWVCAGIDYDTPTHSTQCSSASAWMAACTRSASTGGTRGSSTAS